MEDQTITEVLEGQIAYYRERIEKFKEKLDFNPARAFEYSSEDIRHAAKLEICKIVLAQLKDGSSSAPLEVAREEAFKEILRRGRDTPKSTFTISNLVDHYRLEAWVILWEVLNREIIKQAEGGTAT